MGAYSLKTLRKLEEKLSWEGFEKNDVDTIDGQELEERGPVEALGGRDGEREKLGKG